MISEDVLSFLLTFYDEPTTLPVIRQYLRAYSTLSIKACLIKLRRQGYVNMIGKKKPMQYLITDRGVSRIRHLQTRELMANVNTELEKYLLIKDGGLD